MLCGDRMPVECRDYLDQTYNSALRMNGLIGALLKFSRLGRRTAPRDDFSLLNGARGGRDVGKAEPGPKVDFRIAEGIEADADADPPVPPPSPRCHRRHKANRPAVLCEEVKTDP